MSTIPDQQPGTRRRRRKHSDEFKANAVAACMQPGMSMAAVAMSNGINANLLRRWVQEAQMKPATDVVGTASVPVAKAPASKTLFVPLTLPTPATPAPLADIHIELRRGTTAVTVTWPASAAVECAAWMRELLR